MLELILRLPVMLLIWAIEIALKAVVLVIGLVFMPLTYKYRNTPIGEVPRYLTILINPEDQLGGFPGFEDSLPAFWKKEYGTGRWAHYKYHAIRNPSDGLRNFKILNVVPDPDKIKYITNVELRHYEPFLLGNGDLAYYFCWQGFYLGMHIVYVWSDTRYLTFKFGFRIHPADADINNIDPKGTRALLGASMATKFLPYREWKRRV